MSKKPSSKEITKRNSARPRLTWKKKLLFWSVYIVMMLVPSLLILELASRYVFREYNFDKILVRNQPWQKFDSSSEIVYDPVVGWRAARQYSGEKRHGSGNYGTYPVPIMLHTNADGFRDGDWEQKLERAANSGAKKVLLIGDSVLYGWASEADERLSEQLAQVYAFDGKKVEVFNAGIPAYGTAHEYRLLPELLERIRPDVVILLFHENDYGDTALPYDHRYPYRVYKPFYDKHGELVLNEKVPRRPSLVAKETIFGGFYFWYAVDALYYLLQDIRYKAHDIPNNRTSLSYGIPYPIRWYDWFIYEEDLQKRFPQVEMTVMTLLEKMNQLSKQYKASFFVASSLQRQEYVIAGKIRKQGITFIPAPAEQKYYWEWEQSLYDSHPNFLWAWFTANKIYKELEGKAYAPNLRRLPQLSKIPSEIDFSDDLSSARYLYGYWLPSEDNGRWLNKAGAFLLRKPQGSATQLVLEVTAYSDHKNSEKVINLIDDRNQTLCQLRLIPKRQTISCPIDNDGQGELLFVRVVDPERSSDVRWTEIKNKKSGDDSNVQNNQSAFFQQVVLRVAP